MTEETLRKLLFEHFRSGLERRQKEGRQKVHFEYFGTFVAKWPQNVLRKLILSIFAPWTQMPQKALRTSF